jgi:nucleoside 2-deoxyribosyltransferase
VTSSLDPELLAREGHGAVQVDLPIDEPLVIMLAGPIKVWWAPGQWDSPPHREFVQWRDAVRVACVKAGFLVYSPHRAWQGAWSESAQRVNDMAIEMADVVIDLTPPGVEADGTLAEVAYADKVGTPVMPLPPGDATTIAEALAELSTYPR